MEPITPESSNAELRVAVAALVEWYNTLQEATPPTKKVKPVNFPEPPVPKPQSPWTLEPNKGAWRHIDPETGRTSFHFPESMSPDLKLQLGITEPNEQSS